MNLKISLVFLILVIFAQLVLAAPSVKRIVISESKKECGIFWEGDESTKYFLPSGWKGYPTTGKTDECYYSSNAEKCCEKIGYTYKGEVGVGSMLPIFSLILITIIFIVLIAVFFRYRKKWFK